MERTRPGESATGDRDRHPRLNRLKATTPARAVAAYGQSRISNYSAGLAFNAVMSLFPLILGVLSIIGLVVSSSAVESRTQTAILQAFPGQSGHELSDVLTRDLHHYAGLLGIVGVLGLLWTGTNFFASLEFALSRIFGIRQRSFLRRRAMGALMILVLVAGLLIAVGANTLMTVFPVMAGLGPVAGLVALAALILAFYRMVPSRTFRVRSLWPGAVLAAVPIELITLLFPLYVRLAHGFDTYGQSLALFFLLASWIALLSQVILIGALWNRARLGDEFTASGLLAGRQSGPAPPATVPASLSDPHPAPIPAPPGRDVVTRRSPAPRGERITGSVTTSSAAKAPSPPPPAQSHR